MDDVRGNPLQIGDKVRFWASGGGLCPNPLTLAEQGMDPVPSFRAYGVITSITGDVADIQVGTCKHRWHRTGDCILKR